MTQIELKKNRQQALQQWFEKVSIELGNDEQMEVPAALIPVSGDASFRRYFRGFVHQQSYILVDAPPNKENSRPFVAVDALFAKCGVNVPQVYAVDYEQGFMCLADFGDALLWQELHGLTSFSLHGDDDHAKLANEKAARTTDKATELYRLAFDQLLKIQAINEKAYESASYSLPQFDEGMLRSEMELFREWFCTRLLELQLSQVEHKLLDTCFRRLIVSAQAQPQVCVHRDYHSRNLLYQSGAELGVIDFQDAVVGPFSYDLVSLLKDCYIAWPSQQVAQWALDYASRAYQEGIISALDQASFLSSFDLMGMQRHFKAVGIFSRLYLRDDKPGYLGDIPRTLNYIKEVSERNEPLHSLGVFLEEKVSPALKNRLDGFYAQEDLA